MRNKKEWIELQEHFNEMRKIDKRNKRLIIALIITTSIMAIAMIISILNYLIY